MKLYYADASPFARKVVVVLHETGQFSDVEIINSALSPLAPPEDYRSKNPLSKLPALVRDDGASLYDSRVICAYLDARAGSGLYPTGDNRWDALVLEATADGIMDAAVLMVYEGRWRPKDKQWPDWVEAQWSKVSGGLNALNDNWVDQLNGSLTIGQIAVACALGYLDFRHSDRNWRDDNAALAEWYADFAARDSMVATRPPA